MKIFIDTNIILEYLLNREESEHVETILLWADRNACELVISAGSAYTMTFSIDKYLRKESLIYNPRRTEILRDIMKKIFSRYTVAGMGSEGFFESVSDANFNDLEDSYQWRTALQSECEVLLTLNIKDYSEAPSMQSVPMILSPIEFIERYCRY